MLYQTHVQVHLENIRANIEGIRLKIGPERKILIAVKANAYGHGAIEVSQLAEEIGVDYLGIATVPEGIQLRQAGIHLPILKFGPTFEEEIQTALENDITLAICDKDAAIQTQASQRFIGKEITGSPESRHRNGSGGSTCNSGCRPGRIHRVPVFQPGTGRCIHPSPRKRFSRSNIHPRSDQSFPEMY